MSSQIYALVSSLFCAAVLLVLVHAVRRRGESQELRMLLLVFYGALVYLALETAWGFLEGRQFPGARALNYAVNICDFAVVAFLAFQWLRYYEQCYPSGLSSTRLRRGLCAAPLLVLVLMALSSPFTGWFFYIDRSNVYHAGPLHLVQVLGTYVYLMATVVKGVILSRRADTTAERGTHRSHIGYVLVILAFELIHTLTVNLGIYVHCFGISLGLLLYFVNMQEQHITRDVLTGTNNRYALESYMKARMDDMDRAVMLMLDIDSFKSINDYFGHVEGDRALTLVADALKRMRFGPRFFLARYGGDEFVMIVEAKDAPKAKDMCRMISQAVAGIDTGRDYTLSVSVGWAEKYPGKSAQEWLRAADESMYRVKRAGGEGR